MSRLPTRPGYQPVRSSDDLDLVGRPPKGPTAVVRARQRVTETFGRCWQCGGSGQVFNGLSETSAIVPCPRCAGSGQIVTSRTVEEP